MEWIHPTSTSRFVKCKTKIVVQWKSPTRIFVSQEIAGESGGKFWNDWGFTHFLSGFTIVLSIFFTHAQSHKHNMCIDVVMLLSRKHGLRQLLILWSRMQNNKKETTQCLLFVGVLISSDLMIESDQTKRGSRIYFLCLLARDKKKTEMISKREQKKRNKSFESHWPNLLA